VLLVLQRGADQVTHGIDQHETSRLQFRVEEQSPGLLDWFVLRPAQINPDGAPLVGHRVLVAPVVRRAGELLVQVFEIRDVFVSQWRQQFQFHHRRDDVVGRNHDIVERDPAPLDFREHAFRVFVNIDGDLAAEFLLELLHDLRIDVFAPDEEIQPLLLGESRAGDQQAERQAEQSFHGKPEADSTGTALGILPR